MLEKRQAAQLVQEAVKGDKQAFVALIDLHRQTMYATAIAVTHNEEDALDAIQDTILILWEKLSTLRDPKVFKTWMTRILVNCCCASLRGRKREMPLDSVEEPSTFPDRDSALDVRDALGRLSDEDRLILQLFYFEDMSVKDIAEALSLSPEAVRMRLTRSRKRFRKQYERTGAL